MMRRQRVIGWLLAILGIVVVGGVLGGYLFLKSASFQRLAIRTLVKDTNEATGGRAEIGRLDFQLSTLTAHLYNITLRGAEPSAEPPLLHIDKLTVGIKIQSLLRRKITLSELDMERPVAHVRVDRQGHNNIPQSRRSSTEGHTSVFDLAARHVLVAGGEINYNDTTTP